MTGTPCFCKKKENVAVRIIKQEGSTHGGSGQKTALPDSVWDVFALDGWRRRLWMVRLPNQAVHSFAFYFIFNFILFFVFLGLHLRHMEVRRLGV